jgi:hypothetical protein
MNPIVEETLQPNVGVEQMKIQHDAPVVQDNPSDMLVNYSSDEIPYEQLMGSKDEDRTEFPPPQHIS